jgi:hypothetical protein
MTHQPTVSTDSAVATARRGPEFFSTQYSLQLQPLAFLFLALAALLLRLLRGGVTCNRASASGSMQLAGRWHRHTGADLDWQRKSNAEHQAVDSSIKPLDFATDYCPQSTCH